MSDPVDQYLLNEDEGATERERGYRKGWNDRTRALERQLEQPCYDPIDLRLRHALLKGQG